MGLHYTGIAGGIVRWFCKGTFFFHLIYTNAQMCVNFKNEPDVYLCGCVYPAGVSIFMGQQTSSQ